MARTVPSRASPQMPLDPGTWLPMGTAAPSWLAPRELQAPPKTGISSLARRAATWRGCRARLLGAMSPTPSGIGVVAAAAPMNAIWAVPSTPTLTVASTHATASRSCVREGRVSGRDQASRASTEQTCTKGIFLEISPCMHAEPAGWEAEPSQRTSRVSSSLSGLLFYRSCSRE